MRGASLVFILVVLCQVASCGRQPSPAPAPAPPIVRVDAREYVFSLPEPRSVSAGPVTLRMANLGNEIHMMGVVWLGEHTVPEFVAAVAAHSSLAGTYEVGGPNVVAPGDTSNATVLLPEAGHAALVCWVVAEDGKMHVLKGMVAPLEITGASGSSAAEPVADDSITLRDYTIDLALPVEPGRHVFRVENDGPSDHDLAIFRMEPGATMHDVDAWLQHPAQGSPLARPMGGTVGFGAGRHDTFSADLAPGDYVFVCIMPDEHGVEHYRGHGMLLRFHVGA